MNKVNLDIKKLDDKAIVPTYGSEFSAGFDLYALIEEESVTIQPNETKLIKTGLAMAIPEGFAGLIYARSGLATKKGLAPANKVGVVDADYRGEVMIPLHNHSDKEAIVENGERVAQMIITPFLKVDFMVKDELDSTERGTGGFGSTGVK